MFEAIHGSAPDIAGRGIANPSGLLNSAIMMLVHIGQAEIAEKIHNAWLKTLEDGIHAGEIASSQHTHRQVGTQQFSAAVIERLGQQPVKLQAVHYESAPAKTHFKSNRQPRPRREKHLVGVDVFIHEHEIAPDQLAERLRRASGHGLQIQMITNRGVKVWPEGFPEPYCTDHWRCRFRKSSTNGYTVTHGDILGLLGRIREEGLDFIKTENLCTLDGQPAFSLGQGE